MGYEIVLCRVMSVDTVTKKVRLEPHTPTHFNTIEVAAGDGLKFASTYAPYTSVVDPDKGKVFNTPVGFVNYPQEDDLVLAAIWITDMSRQDRLRTKLAQNQNMEVIIFAKISWHFPDIGTHDNILGDRSGAKIHFNHGWLDTDHLGKDAQGDKSVHLPTGHLTTVANRMVRISGKKFLPFGLHSHNLGKEGVSRDNSKIINEVGGEPISWGGEGGAFTKDPTETNLYNDLLSLSKRGSKKFLEPPCPPPGTMMDFHESGFKRLVELDGQVREYKESSISVIGDDFSGQTMKKVAFDPEEQDEATKLPNQSPGEMLKHFIDDSGAISTLQVKQGGDAASAGLIELEINGISINVKDGDLPTSLPVTFGGETVVKNKILIKLGATVIEIDGSIPAINVTMAAGKKFIITGDLEVTGDVKGGTGTFG